MRKLFKTETLVTIGDMTYVREVTKLTCIVVYVYISSLTQFAYFLSLFEGIDLAATCACLTRYSYPGAGYTFSYSPIYNFSSIHSLFFIG